jgi:3-isopropylmalate/(R)-2-methylmalate dehydratase small subunit
MSAVLRGRAWKYGNNVNTDLLFPGKYTYTATGPQEIASHALEDLDPDFVRNVRKGDIIVGGSNFGCGSSREQAATCLIYNGVAAVIAVSFGRIFYRNAINNGLPVLTSATAVDAIASGTEVEIDLPAPMSATLRRILDAGGLVPYLRQQLGAT